MSKNALFHEKSHAEWVAYKQKRDRIARRLTMCLVPFTVAAVITDGFLMTSDNTEADAATPPKPDSVCDILMTKQSAIDMHKAADDCLHDRLGGKVALIGYGIALPDLQRAASASEDIISEGTGGLARPDIVPILASPQAEKKFHETNPQCGTDKPENGGAVIADQTMDLGRYGHVISVSDLEPCDGVAGGNTYARSMSRYIDIYGQKTMNVRNYYDMRTQGDTMADFVGHEFGHAIGLGHGSSINLQTGGYAYFGKFMSMGTENDSSIELNLTAPTDILSNEYSEYDGPQNLMGEHQGGMIPSSIQLWQLMWPERTKGQVSDTMRTVNGTSLNLGMPLNKIHDFAVLGLKEPAMFKHRDPRDNLIVRSGFSKLVFDPEVGYDNLLHLYFATDDHVHTLELGSVDLGGRHTAMTIKVGKQTIRLEYIKEKGVQITDLTPHSE